MAYEKNGEGAVVMTNTQGGEELASEVMRSIAAEYGWPDYRTKIIVAVSVDRTTLASYVGTYKFPEGFSLAITLKGDRLSLQQPDQPPVRLYPESQVKFILAENAHIHVEFSKDAKGGVAHLLIHQGDSPDLVGLKQLK